MSEEVFDLREFNILKILSPLSVYSEKNDVSFEEIFEKITIAVDKISEVAKKEIKNYEDDKVYIHRGLYEILSDIFLNDYLLNGTIEIDKHIENGKKTIDLIKSNTINFKKNTDSMLLDAVFRVMNEAYQFHNTLYFSDEIKHSEVIKLNDVVASSVVKNIIAILYYYEELLENSNLNVKFKKETIYEATKIAAYIYSDVLSSLYENLSNEKEKLKLYISNPKKFISKVEKIFLENFSKLRLACKKIMETL